jgi:thiamine kinase-like enzyme
MKNLSMILQDDYRIIEFTRNKGLLEEILPKHTKLLTIQKEVKKPDNNFIGLSNKDFIYTIQKNSTDVIVLNGGGLKELSSLVRTSEAQFAFVKITLFNFILLPYFWLKSKVLKKFKYNGLFSLTISTIAPFYLGFKRIRDYKRTTRCYLSPKINIEKFFEELNRNEIKYSILRWFEEISNLGLKEDIDLIVDDQDLKKLHSIILDQPGIIPFDIYSKSGLPGSDYRSLPYYSSSLAEKAITEAVLFNNKFKVPTWENYFLLLAYHTVFHKGEKSGLHSNRYHFTKRVKPDHNYLLHLKNIITKTNLKIDDFTLEGLHLFLEKGGFAPPIDTQYKLSLQNDYLKAYLKDYHNQSEYTKKFEGLVCFVAREKIIELGLLEDLKKYIQKEGFTIIKVKELDDKVKAHFSKKVRGGNWNQGPWPVSGGWPVILIIAVDVYPVEPESSDFELHPGLSNRRIKNKNEIRDFINKSLPSKKEWFNGIHSSDNEIQAVEYFTLADVNEDEIYNEIVKIKKSFLTTYPVLKELSQYSKRAKVELISYQGEKAVKKTFKPSCEIFLENEIKAYTSLKDYINIPEVLEIGQNYFITKYIADNYPLGQRISLKTLKKCLEILRKIYDLGFSLLDFKPGNFLIDNKGNLFLIDFEFFYKYQNKPDFFECYDLIGTPKSINPLFSPNNHIPEGVKQFDALWTKYTGVHFDDLLYLDNSSLYIKSTFRYYYFKINNRLVKYKNKSKKIIKSIFNALP